MVRSRVPVLAALMACLSVAVWFSLPSDAADPASGSDGVAWQKDLKSAHTVAVRENKPLLLVWGADWCTFCKKLEQESLAHPTLARYINDTFVPVHLDYDKDEKVREILEVERLPCTIVLTPEAEQLERFEGFHPATDVYRKLAAARQLHLELTQTASQTGSQAVR